MSAIERCKATRRDGRPCRAAAAPGKDRLCHGHAGPSLLLRQGRMLVAQRRMKEVEERREGIMSKSATDVKCDCGHPVGQHEVNRKTLKIRCGVQGCRCRG
jgi:hypothetical protein